MRGKPAPDIFAHTVQVLGVTPARALGVEDALAGVEAMRAAGFGVIIGIDRTGQRAALIEHGANIVVRDLADLDLVSDPGARGPIVTRVADRAVDLLEIPRAELEWTLVEDAIHPYTRTRAGIAFRHCERLCRVSRFARRGQCHVGACHLRCGPL